jgi:hypothetical protein
MGGDSFLIKSWERNLVSGLVVAFPPAVTDITHDGEGCRGKIKNTRIQGLGWFFTKLLCSFAADGALAIYQLAQQKGNKRKK